MKNLFRNTLGQSTVEMALVLPILLILLFGIFEAGFLFEGYLELENAARDGARYASINSTNFDSTTATSWGTTNLPPKLANDLVMIDSTKVTISLAKSVNSDVCLTLTYDLPLMTPLIGDLIATDKTNNTIRLTSKIAMQGE